MNKNKGLSVISKYHEIEIDSSYDSDWSYFLPININEGELFLLAVWAYHHRAKRQFGNEAVGYPNEVFKKLESRISFGKTVVIGDFNNSVVWDKPKSNNNFRDTAELLAEYGFSSSYHTYYKEVYGKETRKPFFHNKKEHIGHHIDYIYISNETKIREMSVGQYQNWNEISDHVPIKIEI